MASLAPLRQHYHKTDGTIASGYYLTFYAGGTTTPQNTFTDQGGGTPNTNPIQLDSRGEASIWYNPTLTYKVVFSSDALATDVIWTMDLVGSIPDATVFVVDKKGTAIPSAASVNLQTATGNYVHVTGNIGITAITLNEGIARWVTFDGTPTLTHSANLILPNAGSNITVAAGDVMCFRGEGTGVVKCVAYMRYGGYYTKAETDAKYVTPEQIVEGTYNYFTTTASGTDYALTPIPALTTYAQDMWYMVKFHANSDASPTLNISGLGAKLLMQYNSTGSKIAAKIYAGNIGEVTYDGNDFVLLDALPGQAASSAEVTTGSDTTKPVTPATFQYHKAAVKMWAVVTQATNTLVASYNVASITHPGAGTININFAVNMADANYAVSISDNYAGVGAKYVVTKAVNTLVVQTLNNAGAPADIGTIDVMVAGN